MKPRTKSDANMKKRRETSRNALKRLETPCNVERPRIAFFRENAFRYAGPGGSPLSSRSIRQDRSVRCEHAFGQIGGTGESPHRRLPFASQRLAPDLVAQQLLPAVR